MIIDHTLQRTDDWLRLRLGVLTASRVDKLLTPTGKISSQRSGILHELVAEKLTGEPAEDFAGTYWTDRGEALEAEAVAYFELQTGLKHSPVGFVFRDESKTTGCSPDGLILDDDGAPIAGLELKCPKSKTHVGYMLADDKDPYIQQIQFSLWVTGLQSWYFLSYYPGLDPVLRCYTQDGKWQAAFSEHVPTFIAELDAAMEKLSYDITNR